MNLFRPNRPHRLTLVAAVLTLAGIGREQQQPPPPQNVLVLIADDVGVDAIGCYGLGSSPPPTPNIDALAARGVRMTRAHACPTCSPTRACIQTGRYPVRTGVAWPVPVGGEGLDPATEYLLPEVLAASQRPRALFGKWHLGNELVPNTPITEGWPWFEGTMGGEVDDYFHFDFVTNGVEAPVHGYATTVVVDRALAWIGTQNQPWLAMVCFNAGHAPLHEPPALLHGYHLGASPPSRLLFKAMVEAMDTEIGRLLDGLGAARLANTTVIFVGDNGTLSTVVEAPFTPEHAKATLYEGGIHVPLIVAGPAVAAPPRTCEALVDAVDLFPTISWLCGVDPRTAVPASVQLDGVDLRPLLLGTATTVRAFSYSEQEGSILNPETDGQTMQDGRFKLIHFTDALPPDELYDLQADPFELVDLLSGTPSAEALRAQLRLLIGIAQVRGERFIDSFGAGCAGTAGVPVLGAALGAARLGQTHTVRAAPLANATAAFGIIGFSMSTTGAASLPSDLSAFGLTGCSLLVSPDGMHLAVLGPTSASWPMPIPSSNSLLGLCFFQQMAIAEPGANPAGIILSDALAIVIGP